MSTRVYVPSSLDRLRGIVTAGGIGPAPFAAHAVTPRLREAYGEGGEEEWEYAASTAAAQSSVVLLHADEPSRRVVLAVDVPSARPLGADDPTLVEVDEVVPLRRVTAVLVDASDAETAVARARDAVAGGRADAGQLLERCLRHEPGWWASQEIGTLFTEHGLV